MTAPTADATPAIGAIAPKPAVPWVRIVVGIVVAAAAIALPRNYNAETNQIFCQVIYIAIAAMGLNLLTGFNGQVSIGHGAFFGIGAFTTGILVVNHHWAPEATFPIAIVISAAVGVAVGVPALRVKGLYLALLTLGMSVLFPTVVKKYVEGPGGIPLLRPSFKQVSSLIDGMPDDIYRYYVCLLALVIVAVITSNLMRSRTGRAIIAVRDQEVAASTVGIDVARVKVITFALSGAYAGLAGSLSVMVDRSADATNPLIYFQRSIEFLIAVVIGGAATITGPILGAMLLVAIRKRTSEHGLEPLFHLGENQDTAAYAPALLGGALILVVYVLPDGVVGGYRRLVGYARSRLQSGKASPTVDPPQPSPPEPEPPAVQPTPSPS